MRFQHRLKVWILIIVAIAGVVALPFIPRISQDPNYHEFADTRDLLGVPHFWNVITNFPFLFVGLAGLITLYLNHQRGRASGLRLYFAIFLVGVMYVSDGSAAYHYAPSNATLVWDRLPMTMAFMAFLAMVIADCISPTYARKLLWPLLLLGGGSVGYWYATECAGAGDLRLYGLVQFFPVILIPLALVMFGTKSLRARFLWAALATYVAAKFAEHYDASIYHALGVLSGHSIKHLLASLSTFWIVLAVRQPAQLSNLFSTATPKPEINTL